MSTSKETSRELAFDVSKQFLTLAFAGIAFAIAISANSVEAATNRLFWAALLSLALSLLSGFIFLMNAISKLSQEEKYELFDCLPRLLVSFQIITMVAAAVCLLFLHLNHAVPGEWKQRTNQEQTLEQLIHENREHPNQQSTQAQLGNLPAAKSSLISWPRHLTNRHVTMVAVASNDSL